VLTVTTDAIWIGNGTYWTLKQLVITLYTHYHTQTGVLTALLGAVSNGGCSPSSGFESCPRPQLPASRCSSQLTVCLQILSRLTSSSSWSSLYSLRTERTENTASNRSPIVAAITWRLLSHCLAVGVFAEPFLSNSCLCWLRNCGLQQTYHQILPFYSSIKS
jgi:hypothetical protein